MSVAHAGLTSTDSAWRVLSKSPSSAASCSLHRSPRIVVANVHPSSLLRAPMLEDRARVAADLRFVADALAR